MTLEESYRIFRLKLFVERRNGVAIAGRSGFTYFKSPSGLLLEMNIVHYFSPVISITMGVPERKQREKINMKKAILKTATEMYLKDGFENLSIRAIATRMEYSVGTMYIYYKDRAELINALMEEGHKKLLKTLQTVKHDKDPLIYLEKIMRKYVEFAFENTVYYDLMFILGKPLDVSEDEEDWKNGLSTFRMLTDAVQQCIKLKMLRYDDTKIASLHIWSFMHGLVCLFLKRHLLPLGNPEQTFLESSMNSFVRAIKA